MVEIRCIAVIDVGQDAGPACIISIPIIGEIICIIVFILGFLSSIVFVFVTVFFFFFFRLRSRSVRGRGSALCDYNCLLDRRYILLIVVFGVTNVFDG